jgi:hypothetical protein
LCPHAIANAHAQLVSFSLIDDTKEFEEIESVDSDPYVNVKVISNGTIQFADVVETVTFP